ncbi:MAG: hypothetical protein OES57_14895, partial [Acidimicrobiia bacterium]|nr:hypothetical protein [Acidimicrobiia bacterium]
MTKGPTRGVETLDEIQSWSARPAVARLLRLVIVLAPALTSLSVTWLAAPHLYRPAGDAGV